jgi:dTMP kinase
MEDDDIIGDYLRRHTGQDKITFGTKMNKGKLIVFEGADAVGKNSMSTRLAEEISKAGRSSRRISFPRYETPLGRAILAHLKEHVYLADDRSVGQGEVPPRAPEDALMFQCMMVADKYHAASEISKLLRDGVEVVCDRYWQSAYAFGGSDGLDEQWLLDIHEMMPKPDLNILLALSPEEALKRRPQLRDRYEKDEGTQIRVRENYLKLWEREEKRSTIQNWRVVDASRSKDEVFADVLAIYNQCGS